MGVGLFDNVVSTSKRPRLPAISQCWPAGSTHRQIGSLRKILAQPVHFANLKRLAPRQRIAARFASRPRDARPHESAEAAKYKARGASDENAEQWTLVVVRAQDDRPDETSEERDNADDKPRQKCALHVHE